MEGWGFNHCQNYASSAHKNRGSARLDKRPARLLAEPAFCRAEPSWLLLTGLSVLQLDYLSILKYVAKALHSPGVTTILPEYENK